MTQQIEPANISAQWFKSTLIMNIVINDFFFFVLQGCLFDLLLQTFVFNTDDIYKTKCYLAKIVLILGFMINIPLIMHFI